MFFSSPILYMRLYIHIVYNSKLYSHIYSAKNKFLHLK